MDCRLDMFKTLNIRRQDSGELVLETRQLRAICRQAGRQAFQFSSDLRQNALELRDDLHGTAVRAQLCMPAVIHRPAAEPASLANQARRPDHILTIADHAGVHGEPGKLAERHDILIRRDGEHSRPQRFPGFTAVGDGPVLTVVNQRDLEMIAGAAGDLRRVAPYPLDFSFELDDGGLRPPFALLKKRLMLGGEGDPARLLPQVRKVAAGIEKGKLIADLAGCSGRAPLHRAAPPCDCPCS
jgi:hypothetical protein